jgi:methylated-DNA-[protein]-cysteine S-methyltransferase
MKLMFDTIQTPIGAVTLVVLTGKLVFVDFEGNEARMKRLLTARFGAYTPVAMHDPHGFSTKLLAYFAGDLGAVRDIPVSTGGTPLQAQVWNALREIPAGETISYGALAARFGKPGAVRAVGTINSLNPISIVLPCHRVIGANGDLTGYAGGLERKHWLLTHEGAQIRAPRAHRLAQLQARSEAQPSLF